MPEGDLLLAEPPAEQHLLTVTQRGKVDQAAFDALHLRSESLDLLDTRADRTGLPLESLLQLREVARRQVATVAGYPAHRLRVPRARLVESAAVRDHLLDQRPQLGQRSVRLVGCEEALRHPGIIRGLVGRGQRLRAAELDAVTVDAYGTLLELSDPVPALTEALRARGVERSSASVRAAFAAEVEYYVPRSHEGRDDESLSELRRACAGVFLDTVEADLEAADFAPAFVAAIEFRIVAGAREALDVLGARGLALGVVANWDCSLADRLVELGLRSAFATVVTSAEAGAAKPAAEIFTRALAGLAVESSRVLHVGDSEVDRLGASAAGLRFAPAPLALAAGALE